MYRNMAEKVGGIKYIFYQGQFAALMDDRCQQIESAVVPCKVYIGERIGANGEY